MARLYPLMLLLLALSSLSYSALSFNLTQNLTGFKEPSGLFVDPQGTLYVVDSGTGADSSTIWNFDYNGTFIGRTGSWGSDIYNFITPRAFYIDSSGKRYVADTGNNRVLIYAPAGTWLQTLGEGGAYNLNNPRGLFVDSERLFVADSYNNRIVLFNRSGRGIISILGLDAVGDEKPVYPQKVFATGTRIYVTDHAASGNDHYGRVAVYGLGDFKFLGAAGRGANGVYLNYPEGLAIDFTGKIYVADTGNNRVQIFWADYSPMASLDANASGAFNFSGPRDVFLFRDRLYVADTGHKRVLVYNITESSASSSPEYARTQVELANSTIELIKRLNSTGSRLGVSLSGDSLSQFNQAVLLLSDAYQALSFADYQNAVAKANASLASASSARLALSEELEEKLEQNYESLSARLEKAKADSAAYNVSLDTSSAYSDLQEAKSLITAGDLETAAQSLTIAATEVLNLEISLDAQTRLTRSSKEAAEQSIAYVTATAQNLSSLASSYNLSFDSAAALALASQAQSLLDSFDFISANEKATRARNEIDSAKAGLLDRISKIDRASAKIREAEEAINASKGRSILFFSPNMRDAESLASQARSLLYTDPDASFAKAVQAKQSVERENANLDLLQPLVLAGAIGLVLLLLLLAVFFLYSKKKASEITDLANIGKIGEIGGGISSGLGKILERPPAEQEKKEHKKEEPPRAPAHHAPQARKKPHLKISE